MKRRVFIGTGALALAGGGAYWLNANNALPGTTADAGFGAAMAETTDEIDTSGVVEMAMGDKDAPVTVVEYASFTCPHCSRFHTDVLPQIKKNYIDTRQGAFHFPRSLF